MKVFSSKRSPESIRKLLVSTAVSSALSISMAFGQSAFADNRQVELVPDDSMFYMGTGRPVPVEHFFAMIPDFFNPETLEKIIPDSSGSDKEAEFFKQVGEFFNDPKKVTEQWGIGEELQFSAYTIGLMPVLRIKGDAKKFEAAITTLSAEQEFEFVQLEHKGINVRISSPDKSDDSQPKIVAPDAAEFASAEAALADATSKATASNEKLSAANKKFEQAKKSNDASGIAAAANDIAAAANEISDTQKLQIEAEKKLASLQQLQKEAETLAQTGGISGPGVVIAADGKDIILAFSFNAYDPAVLDQLLGLEKPQKSLAASGKLKKIRKEWNYSDEMVMFIDHQLVADGVTGGDSLAAQHLTVLAADLGMPAELERFAAEPCRTEIRQLAAHWPMTVTGNRKFEVDENNINLETHFATIIEHEALRNTLKLLRGVVPVSQSSGEAMMSFGMGIDVNNLPQLSGEVIDLLSKIDYQCDSFGALNELAKADISAASMGAMMFSGMARGIKGFSVNVYDADIAPDSRQMPVKGVDAAIAIAADDPAMLLQTLKMLPQGQMLSELPLDGTAMSLNDLIPMPLPPEVELFAAIKGKNIVIYSGTEAAEFANRIGGNGKEGFVVASFNTAKLIEKIESVAETLTEDGATDEDLAGALEMMSTYPTGNVVYEVDFTDRGIELESVSEFKRADK